MNAKIASLIVFVLFINVSCIDRNTIAGTGQEIPDSIMGAGGDLQSGTIRAQLSIPLRVRVLASNGRPVRGIVVEYSNPLSRVSFSDTIARTNSDGYASTIVTLGTTADTIKVYATVLGIKGSPVVFTLVARASYEAKAEIVSGDKQEGIVSGPLSSLLRVKVLDPYNNPVKNVVAVYSTNNGKFNNSFVQTDSAGIASSIWTLDTLIGSKTASVTFPSLPNVTLQFTATAKAHAPARMAALSNDSIHAMEGFPLPGGLKVKLEDKFGNPNDRQNVRFSIVAGSPGIDTVRNFVTGVDGIATATISLAYGDSVVKVYAYSPQYPLPIVPFHITQYIYSQIDSLRSSGGTVELFWERNLNKNFVNYTVERCLNFNFDQSTVIVQTITDQNIISVIDSAPPAGSSPYYRIKMNYLNNFYFYTNIRQVAVQP